MPIKLTDQHASLLRAETPRYVFFDVDGTLKNSRHEISLPTANAVRALGGRNIGYGLASGRPFFGATNIMEHLQVRGPSVFFSGALVIDPATGATLHEAPLRAEEVRYALDFGRKHGIFTEVYTAEDYFCEARSPLGDIHALYLEKAPQVARLDPLVDSSRILKVEFVADTPEQHEALRRFAADTPSLHFGLGYGASHPQLVFGNVTSRNASREHAFEAVSKHLGIGCEHIAAFGDAEADIPFLRLAGLGIAMGNAPLAVQEAARFVTKSVDEDGVAYALGLLEPQVALVDC